MFEGEVSDITREEYDFSAVVSLPPLLEEMEYKMDETWVYAAHVLWSSEDLTNHRRIAAVQHAVATFGMRQPPNRTRSIPIHRRIDACESRSHKLDGSALNENILEAQQDNLHASG